MGVDSKLPVRYFTNRVPGSLGASQKIRSRRKKMRTRFVFALIMASFLALTTNDAMAQWYKIPQLQYSRIWSIISTNDSAVFVGADNGTLLRSTDGGLTWTNLATWENGLEADTILSLVKGDGYIFAGTNGPGGLYQSSDNGDSWTLSGPGFPGNTAINGMAYSNGVVYAAANIGVYASADSGKSWKADTTGLNMGPWYEYSVTPSGIVGIAAVDSTLYTVRSWDINTRGGVYMAHEDSITWKPIGLDGMPTYGLFAVTTIDTNVFVATAQGIFLYSGSGAQWLTRNNGLPLNDTTSLQSCLFATVDSLLFVYVSHTSTYSYGKGIYVTSDLGETWTEVNDSTFGQISLTSMVATGKYLFAGTQSGAWRIPISDIITSVDNRPQLPTGFSLSQNFPNPFNPTTVISYHISAISNVTLKVYDVLGREIATLVDEKQFAGSHAVKFNAANLPTGVYFYRLSTGNFTSTKKALLLK